MQPVQIGPPLSGLFYESDLRGGDGISVGRIWVVNFVTLVEVVAMMGLERLVRRGAV